MTLLFRFTRSRCMTSLIFFFFSSRRRHTRCSRDWSSDVCSSDLRVRNRLDKADCEPVTVYVEHCKSAFQIELAVGVTLGEEGMPERVARPKLPFGDTRGLRRSAFRDARRENRPHLRSGTRAEIMHSSRRLAPPVRRRDMVHAMIVTVHVSGHSMIEEQCVEIGHSIVAASSPDGIDRMVTEDDFDRRGGAA